METKQPVRRLCSEIQLFDLCDLETCRQKDGRYCVNKEALERFEAIQEEEEPTSRYLSEDLEDGEEDDELGADDDFAADEYEDDDM